MVPCICTPWYHSFSFRKKDLYVRKKYDHLKVEEGKYKDWVNHGYFEEKEGLPPYAIVIPPPNVTGKLHLGHAWDTTLQDIIIRFKKCKVLMLYGFQEWIMLV